MKNIEDALISNGYEILNKKCEFYGKTVAFVIKIGNFLGYIDKECSYIALYYFFINNEEINKDNYKRYIYSSYNASFCLNHYFSYNNNIIKYLKDNVEKFKELDEKFKFCFQKVDEIEHWS